MVPAPKSVTWARIHTKFPVKFLNVSVLVTVEPSPCDAPDMLNQSASAGSVANVPCICITPLKEVNEKLTVCKPSASL